MWMVLCPLYITSFCPTRDVLYVFWLLFTIYKELQRGVVRRNCTAAPDVHVWTFTEIIAVLVILLRKEQTPMHFLYGGECVEVKHMGLRVPACPRFLSFVTMVLDVTLPR